VGRAVRISAPTEQHVQVQTGQTLQGFTEIETAKDVPTRWSVGLSKQLKRFASTLAPSHCQAESTDEYKNSPTLFIKMLPVEIRRLSTTGYDRTGTILRQSISTCIARVAFQQEAVKRSSVKETAAPAPKEP
jgi:hypothetical protein